MREGGIVGERRREREEEREGERARERERESKRGRSMEREREIKCFDRAVYSAMMSYVYVFLDCHFVAFR